MNNDFLILNDGTLFKYKGSESVVHIPENVTAIASRFLSQCTSEIKEVVVSKSVVTIDYDAFLGCKTIEKVTAEEGLAEIGDNAFNQCINLKEIHLSNGVKKIGKRAFSKCINLKKIVLPDSVEEIGEKAFEFCKSDIEIVASNDVFAFAHKQFDDREKYTLALNALKHNDRFRAISSYYKRNEIPIIISIADRDDVDMLKNFLSLYKRISADKLCSYIEFAKNSKNVLNELIQYKENACSK